VPVRNANRVCIYLIPARRTLFFGSWVLAVYTALEPHRRAAPHVGEARAERLGWHPPIALP